MLAEFLLSSVISGSIAIALYLVAGAIFSRFYNRNVQRDVLMHDFKFGIVSLVAGSPMLQAFRMADERWDISMMYTDIGEYGWIWWLVSLPLYVACWDAVFYVTHLILHTNFVYKISHFRHHACRPPVPWSGIAIDPIETVFSGILPYTVPLFFLPFHIYTVYALNIALMFWATMVHSSLDWSGNAVMLSTKDHNLHHAFGKKNANFGAVFTFWDRMGRTLNRRDTPPWWGKVDWGKKKAGTPVAPGTEYPDLVAGSSEAA